MTLSCGWAVHQALSAVAGRAWWLVGARSAPPPAVAGVGSAGPRDAWRYSKWNLGGYAHRARTSNLVGRCCSVVLLIVGVVMLLPVLWPVQMLLMARPWCRYYTSSDAFSASLLAVTDGTSPTTSPARWAPAKGRP